MIRPRRAHVPAPASGPMELRGGLVGHDLSAAHAHPQVGREPEPLAHSHSRSRPPVASCLHLTRRPALHDTAGETQNSDGSSSSHFETEFVKVNQRHPRFPVPAAHHRLTFRYSRTAAPSDPRGHKFPRPPDSSAAACSLNEGLILVLGTEHVELGLLDCTAGYGVG